MNIIDIILIIVFFVNIILSTLIFIHRRESSGSTFFAIAAYSTTLWVFAMFLFRNISDLNILIIPTKLLYIAGILIAVNFLYFSYIFLENSLKKKKNLFWLISILPFVSIILIIFSENIIKDVIFTGNEKIVRFGSLYLFYGILMFIYFIWAYTNLFKKFKKIHLVFLERRQLLYIIVGTSVSIIFGLIYDIMVPYLGNFNFYWLGPVMTITFVSITSYSISKHHLFNIRVIATELLTFSIWIFVLIRMLLSETTKEWLINGSLLTFVAVSGILLIRSVLKEVRMREQMEELAKELEKANVRLRELDKEKSDFVTITSHQLRAPLTAIKGYTSMLIEGSYGPVSDKVKEILDRVFQSSSRLVFFISDLLNLSRIERGKMEYDFKKISFRELAQEVFEDFRTINIKENKGMEMSFEAEKIADYSVTADFEKIRQVVYNLVDNAIKYNKPGGFIKVNLQLITNDQQQKSVLLKVQDNGIGMSKESLVKIFEKFVRGQNGGSVNTEGTGLGLYVAREIAKAHNGNVWAESEGEGKGSAFYLELPVVIH